MASCSIGTVPELKLFNFQPEFSKIIYHAPCKVKCTGFESFPGLRQIQKVNGPVHSAWLDKRRWRLANSLAVRCLSDEKEHNTDNAEKVKSEEKPSTKGQIVPSSLQVQSLLTAICGTTSIAEFELKVGFFRTSRTIKGKRAPPSCKELQQVKEGQVVCYVEQLGGGIPIESDVSGELIKILRRDGEPVGYGDALIATLPSFPGIKKLQ